MTPETDSQIKNTGNNYGDMPFIAKILHNIREVIAWDSKQKLPLILRLNEAFIFKIARKAILEEK